MIRILTDSTADITPALAEQLNVDVVPLRLFFGDETYADGVDLSHAEFYERLAKAEKLPTTSQPNPDSFLPFYRAAAEAGDEVLVILISGKLSGTLQSATIAADEFDNVTIVDSLNATLGLQLLVRLAVRLRDEGKTVAEIAAELEQARGDICLFAVVDDLKYFRKGGRLSGAEAFAGTLLGIKPVVSVKEGTVGVAGKARGLPGAYVALFKLIEQAGGIDAKRGWMVGYTAHHRACEPILRYLEHNLHLLDSPVAHIGTVVGTHAGPGAAGIAFFRKHKQEAEA